MPRIETAEITVNGRKKIVNADDPRVQNAVQKEKGPQEVTRDSIDAMKKADVVDLLEAHGAETGGKLTDLRERLKAVMFVGL